MPDIFVPLCMPDHRRYEDILPRLSFGVTGLPFAVFTSLEILVAEICWHATTL